MVVNLYPFETTVARKGVTWDEAIEQIDIGGPAMVRAAAKNHAFTTIATDARAVLGDSRPDRRPTAARRPSFAAGWPARPSPTRPSYDRAIADFFAGQRGRGAVSGHDHMSLARKTVLRYGENPHQQAALYARPECRGASVAVARQLHGKELSYNNLLDLDSAPGDCPPVCRAGGRGDQAQQSLRRRGGRTLAAPCSGRWTAIR